MKINIKELDDVILRDLSGAVRNCEDKWPLIIDQNDQAITYLRYRDTNFINCLDMQVMKPEPIRRALLGAIRYIYFFLNYDFLSKILKLLFILNFIIFG